MLHLESAPWILPYCTKSLSRLMNVLYFMSHKLATFSVPNIFRHPTIRRQAI